ncbi:hypothetical protein SD78_4444 [Bacillus badius]|nr:hypothetical protein SD78_4444 [Bacillus badius]
MFPRSLASVDKRAVIIGFPLCKAKNRLWAFKRKQKSAKP